MTIQSRLDKMFESLETYKVRFSFGADPEFILIDEKGNLKSAINILKKDKSNKISINNNFFYYDNVLAECTVKPGFSKKETIKNIKESLSDCSKLISPFKLTSISSAEFNDQELNHIDARKSGCEAEFCAYKLRKVSSKKIKKIFKESNLRSAGGHIHIGSELGKSHDTCIMLVRMLDLFLGVPSLILDTSPNSFIRRKIYGKAGRYRQPKHGAEYRTLSNFWLSSPDLVELMYEICDFVINSMDNKIYENFWTIDYDTLNSDKFWNSGGDPSTCYICHGYDVSLLKKLFHMTIEEIKIHGSQIINLVYSIIPHSIKNKIKDISARTEFDMYKEWNLKCTT